MPIDPEDFLAEGRDWEASQKSERRSGTRPAPVEDGHFSDLFQRVGEGKRNSTLTRFVGYLRAKRMDYPAGLFMARAWNEEYCSPPMDEREVEDLVSRAWVEWAEGDKEDATPDEFGVKKPEKVVRALLTIDDLLDLEAAGLGLTWLVPNVFVMGGLHIVSAPASGGKSWWLLDLARCITTGQPWIGIENVRQGPVLYVDEEMGEGKTADRVKKLGFDRGTPFYYFGKQGLQLPRAEDRKLIKDTADEIGACLIIVDTITGVMPGMKENEAEHVSRLRSYFNEINTPERTIVVAHHDRKGGAGDSSTSHERMAGSRDFAAMADMAYGIDKRGGMHHVTTIKNRYLSDEDALEMDFTLENSEEKTRVTVTVIGDDEKRKVAAVKVSKRLRYDIAEALLQGPLLTNQVTDFVKASRNAVIAELKSMVESGDILTDKKAGQGGGNIYSLPPPE